MATPKRRGPKRKRGPRVLKFAGARVADLNASARYGLVRDALATAADLERRERELPTLTDPDDIDYARECIRAIRHSLGPFPIRTVADAARFAEWWGTQHRFPIPAERARIDYHAARRAWKQARAAKTAAEISDAASALEQALARVSAIRPARK